MQMLILQIISLLITPDGIGIRSIEENNMNSHDIKKLSELENIITPENFNGFVDDFVTWLALCVTAKHTKPQQLKLDFTHFRWIDDGKHDIEITIK
jgi:hypothetical protein